MLRLVPFSLLWILCIYALNCLLAGTVLKPSLKDATVYILTMISLGLVGEVGFDSIYKAVFGHSLWSYHLAPIHDSYTSLYSLFLWGLVGFHLCLLHETLSRKGIRSIHKLAILFCLEAIVLEALVNISFLAAFGSYIYYYLPADLGHITSLQTLPLYLAAGYITVTAMKHAKALPRLSIAGSSLVVFGILNFR